MSQVLFVHGALVRDGAWWWQPVAQVVERTTGVPSQALALPSCGETVRPPGLAELGDDAQALRRALDAASAEGDDVLVVGHSYGGTVVAEGAEHPAARHLLYITSYLPDPGTAQAEILQHEPDPVQVVAGPDGTVELAGLTEESFAGRFLSDVADHGTRREAWRRVTAQSAAALGTPTTHAAWRTKPSTYLVCAQDASTTLELQRWHAERATETVELPTGHHPFLSRPDLVAREVERLLRGWTR